MVILKNLPFRDKLNLAMMIEYDTKKVIQEHAKLINVSLPSSYRKGEMAEGLATLFQHDPFYTVNQLPMDEQKLIAQLINLKFDECVEVPRNEAKYSWASYKENPVQQSIADALMYIGFMKLV